MANPVVHFEILAKQGEKKALQDFYAKTFDWDIQPVGDMEYGMLVKPDGEHGIGGAVDEQESGAPGVMVHIEVDDPVAYLERAVANGATKIMDVMVIPGMVTYGLFADPAGNVMGIVARETPPAA